MKDDDAMKRLEEDADRRRTDPRVIVSLVTLCLTAIVQLCGGIWWAATVSSDLRYNTMAVAAMQNTTATKDEVRAGFRNVDERTSELSRRIGTIEATRGGAH